MYGTLLSLPNCDWAGGDLAEWASKYSEEETLFFKGWDRRRRCDLFDYDPPCGICEGKFIITLTIFFD